MKIPKKIRFILFIIPTFPKFPKDTSVNPVRCVIFESGEESSSKQAELIACPVLVLLLLCSGEGERVIGYTVKAASMLSLFFFVSGGTKVCQLVELELVALAGLELQREVKGSFPWGSVMHE